MMPPIRLVRLTSILLVMPLCPALLPADEPTSPIAATSHDDDRRDMGMLEQAQRYVDAREPVLDGFIVVHDGDRLVERYYRGFDQDELHELQSATKTFTSLLIGIAIDLGIVKRVDQPISELLPDYRDRLVGKKSKITVRHLLTMTSGLKWTDFGPGNSFQRIGAAVDSVDFILREPLESDPGEKFFYNTGSSHLLSAIIHKNSGMTTTEFADKHLFEPLDIQTYRWPKLNDGIAQGGWGMYMKPRDMQKFGQLMLDRGRWNDRQLVSASYIDDATQGHVGTYYGTSRYGYQMWIETDLGADDVAAARGYGGQDIFVLAGLNSVVVFTGSIAHPMETKERIKTILRDYVIPALPPAATR